MKAALLDAQNPDGGWGAHPGTRSWTETTAWALLALHGREPDSDPVARGVAWLRAAQLPDGGFGPSQGIGEASWVSAAVALAPPALLGAAVHGRTVAAVVAGAETLPQWTDRLRQWMLGQKPTPGPPARGWAWVPGTAPWLVPTAVSILALRKYAAAENPLLLEHARNYLLARQCEDGGWNHGSSRVLGYDGASYPETTGLALLALRGMGGAAIERGLAAAERHAHHCQTLEGASWLRLALHVHGRTAIHEPPARTAPDNREMAVALIAERSLAGEELLWTK